MVDAHRIERTFRFRAISMTFCTNVGRTSAPGGLCDGHHPQCALSFCSFNQRSSGAKQSAMALASMSFSPVKAWSAIAFKQGQRFRAGIEGRIRRC
jgi:hypothetical protein